MPNPHSFAKHRWHHEVEQGIRLYRKSQRDDLVIPDFVATLAWFEKAAPESLSFPPPDDVRPGRQHFFEPNSVSLTGDHPSPLRAISHALLLSDTGERPRMAMTDMWEGHVWLASKDGDALDLEWIGRAAHPAHVESTDLDHDGQPDYVVADLGGMLPTPHKRGSVWWFHQVDGEWRRTPLRMGMMRVSDVRAGDFDGDGKTDLVVAEFGMHFQGGIHLLLHRGLSQGVPQFESKLLDDRAGGIHVPPIDLDGDGALDFVALISQHHEVIVAFLNAGDGAFQQATLYEAGDPSYGSSGIELVDLDRDGDIDVLFSNGDTFDDEIPKPVHSVQWLENRGDYPFEHHHIGALPGAYRAVAADLDEDGDLDVAAVSLLVEASTKAHPSGTFDGVVLFEQLENQRFIRHRLQEDLCQAATCQLIDWDLDGDLDIVTFPYNTQVDAVQPITVFRNTR